MSTETTPSLTLGQRLAADSPAFFKKTELVGLALIGISATLSQYPTLIPANLIAIIASVGATLSVISKFAVKDVSVLNNPNATIQDYGNALSQLPAQYQEIKAGINQTIAAINTKSVVPAVPVADTPIVKEAVIATETPVEIKAPTTEETIAPAPPIEVIPTTEPPIV